MALLSVLTACATLEQQKWFQQTRDVATKTGGTVATATTAAFKRMQGYLAKKDLLKTFHDSAEHSEDAVLGVLNKAGIGRGAAGSAGAKPPTTKPSPSTKPAQPPGTAQPSKPAKPSATPAKPSPPKTPNTVPPPSSLPPTYAGDYRWPVDAGIISSEYGDRWGKKHKGLDIAADVGEPIYAVAPGEVLYSGSGLSGYGNVIILRHDKQMTSLYAHNSALKVSKGAQIKQGDLIALLGNTGRSTGPHVHFEVRNGDQPVNPRSLLPKSTLAEAVFGRGVVREYLVKRAD